VRFNGGAQAGHNVVTDDGRHHTFAQLGAGTFAGAATHLSRFVVVHPTALLVEARVLGSKGVVDPLAKLSVSPDALVTTPFHVATNRILERARGGGAHGTCGVGFGATVEAALEGQAIRFAELPRPAAVRRSLRAIRERERARVAEIEDPEVAVLEDPHVADRWLESIAPLLGRDLQATTPEVLAAHDDVVFEGAQGVLLDEHHGFHPHTTWSTCTFRNAEALCHDRPLERLGVLRTYQTRHGAGPFPSEDPELRPPEPHNGDAGWQGTFRRGPLDLVLTSYALRCAPVDALVLTHLDVPVREVVTAYEPLGDDALAGLEESTPVPLAPTFPTRADDEAAILEARRVVGDALRRVTPRRTETTDVVATVEAHTGVPIRLTSHGPCASHKRVRRDALRDP